jgi:hypothetical protein
MKQIDFTPIIQSAVAIALCCIALSVQIVYPHSNVIPFAAALLGLLLCSELSNSGSRRGAEYSVGIMLGMFVLAWIIVPIAYLDSFSDDIIARRKMWIDIYSLLFVPFIGACYERSYA